MAKMFYSLEEAAQRMGVTPNEVRDLVSSGQLQEYRDRDKVMFKTEQVDMLVSHQEDEALDAAIPLADSGGGSGLSLSLDEPAGESGSGSGIALEEESPKERSGISIFDADQLETADPSAVTQITSSQGGGELTMESVGSGSGLLDLTREGDDTSLGADLLEGVYSGDAGGSGVMAAAEETQGTSGLFETTGAASDVSGGLVPAGGMMMVAAEPFDPAWSGIAGGLAFGTVVLTALALVVTLFGITGAGGGKLVEMFMGSWPWMFVGVGVAVLGVAAVVGWAIGKRG
ncbi:MAG: helix-turn-helix domain-containing protein [Phycisphaerales bacterium]|nr:helix-turn-helix domain-containing protein [Phycisphaerales bacterium]